MADVTSGAGRRAAVYFGSFNAEAAWRDPAAASLPEVKDAQAQRTVDAMEELQFVFCEEGDVLLTARPMLPGHREHLASLGFHFGQARPGETLPAGATASPYAVVPGHHELCARHGLAGELPPLHVVRRVNSKVYSHHLATALSLPGAGCLVRSSGELLEEGRRHLSRGHLVVKDPMGVSGKGAMVIRADRELEWLRAHLARQENAGRFIELLIQPLHERAADFSCHFEVSAAGFRPLGVQAMDNEGLSFSAVRPAPRELQELLDARGQWEVMERVARALGADGYRGPVCVDGMLLRDGTLVPLLEINARKSMGLINLRLQERAANGLESLLGFLGLAFSRRVSFDELLEALRRKELLHGGERPGVIPLSGNAMVANLEDAGEPRKGEPLRARGRLYVAVLAGGPGEAARLLDGVRACLEALGVGVTGMSRG